MTWSVVITDKEGKQNACQSCKHNTSKLEGQPSRYSSVCNVQKMAPVMGYALTSIDVGADNHMASGVARLECHGYEAKPTE